MQAVERQVSDLRGLKPRAALQRTLLDPAGLALRVEHDLLQGYGAEQAAQDAQAYALLGFIDPGLDLRQLYMELMAEQVAGFYDSITDEMVLACRADFNGVERLTYAHEFDHALVDQVFNPESSLELNETGCATRTDRCLAARALIEGDASLLQEQWLRTFGSAGDLGDLLAFLNQQAMPAFASAPVYIQAEMTFPYLEGLAFVRSIYLQGGWAAVDALYASPPRSSEQILHPDRYPRDQPVELQSPDLLGALGPGWSEATRDSLGEWRTLQLLLEQVDEETARAAAGGWGGDLLFVFEQVGSGSEALVLITQWDTLRDAREFAEAFEAYASARFGVSPAGSGTALEWESEHASAQLVRQSNQTVWILAPDAELRAALSAAIRLPLWPVP